MQVVVITLFPEMFSALTDSGISSRALKNGLVKIDFVNPRQHTEDKHQTVDDRPYGGGPGMVMSVTPLARSVDAALAQLSCAREDATVLYMSPQGKPLNRATLDSMISDQGESATVGAGKHKNLIMICGRYEGVDERFIEAFVDEEWSIGDYVLSGGELPAMVVLDALIRKLPGALGDQQSAEQDSFESGLLDCPHYTRPESVLDKKVPEVLLSGDHERIRRWRLQQSLVRTYERRPDLLSQLELTPEQQQLLDVYCSEKRKK